MAPQILGDRDLPWLAGIDLVVDPPHQAPAVFQFGRRIPTAPHVADVSGCIPSQPIDPEILQPQQSVVAEVTADLVSAIVGACIAPRRTPPPVVVKIDAAAVVLVPAVKAPQIEIGGAQVVVDDVHDHGNAGVVGGPNERLECVGTAVVRLDGERMGRVVPP